MPETTEVKICGRIYKVASDDWQPLYVQKLASRLDSAIRKMEEDTGIVDNYKLLVLSGLKLIDEILKLEDKKTGSDKTAESRLEKLNSKLESLLT